MNKELFSFLTSGGHINPADGLCLMEAVAQLAGEKHSSNPACVDPVLSAFGRFINDAPWSSDYVRTQCFTSFNLPGRLIGTATTNPFISMKRAELLTALSFSYIQNFLSALGISAESDYNRFTPEHVRELKEKILCIASVETLPAEKRNTLTFLAKAMENFAFARQPATNVIQACSRARSAASVYWYCALAFKVDSDRILKNAALGFVAATNKEGSWSLA